MTSPPPKPLRVRILDGQGGGRAVPAWDDVLRWTPKDGPLWLHVDADDEATSTWFLESSGLPETMREALVCSESRPRCHVSGDALLVVLRGVNLNPGADPEDMVALRMWISPRRVVSASRRPVMAVKDVFEALDSGSGPKAAGDLLTWLGWHLLERMGPALLDLDEKVDDLEERLDIERPGALQRELADLRRTIIALRRHLAPQREVLARLTTLQHPVLDAEHLAELVEHSERLTRHVENLEELRDRTTVAHDLLASRQAEDMNRRMLVVSLVAAIFLPLSLLTGLLGINVGGIPGAQSPLAFSVVCAIILGLGGLQFLALRRMNWL
ncbi:MAG: zinc transporter ZntB [Planctomycetes bacterium]|nr:zinc transporter ZntB [Planctomycetota bacterium]